MLRPYFTLRASPTPRVHFSMWIRTQSFDLKQRRAIDEPEPRLAATVGSATPGRGDQGRELRVTDAATQRVAQIRALLGVDRQKPPAVSRQTAAIPRTAEWGR